MLSEREIIQIIRQRSTGPAYGVVQSIGDDCAVFRTDPASLTLVTTDTLVEGVHFDRSWHPAALLGRKSVAVNASDIAAMAGRPRFAFLSLVLPSATDDLWLEDFLHGFAEGLTRDGLHLLGGDTVRGAQVVISVTMIGQVPPAQVLYRRGAQKDDLVWVSGFLGEAAAGLELCRRPTEVRSAAREQLATAHLDPAAQVELGAALGASGLVRAMMDLSDGLATDLAHLGAESGLGAEVRAEALPISPACLEAAAALRHDPYDWALRGGEDYQLLFTAPADHRAALEKLAADSGRWRLSCIGRMVEAGGVVLIREGRRLRIDYQGYDHFQPRENG